MKNDGSSWVTTTGKWATALPATCFLYIARDQRNHGQSGCEIFWVR